MLPIFLHQRLRFLLRQPMARMAPMHFSIPTQTILTTGLPYLCMFARYKTPSNFIFLVWGSFYGGSYHACLFFQYSLQMLFADQRLFGLICISARTIRPPVLQQGLSPYPIF